MTNGLICHPELDSGSILFGNTNIDRFRVEHGMTRKGRGGRGWLFVSVSEHNNFQFSIFNFPLLKPYSLYFYAKIDLRKEDYKP